MAEIHATDRARLHALLDEAIDGEHEIIGIAIIVELASVTGEIKLRALLGQHAPRLREILATIRKP